MGYTAESLNYVETLMRAHFGDLQDRTMLELGDQTIVDGKVREITAKKYYSNRGIDHVSFDLNGRHGAIKVDLSQPCTDARWRRAFDAITNIGTSEHVEPFEGQYACFANIHGWVKPGGLIIHAVPSAEDLDGKGIWRTHCQYYYGREFFENLASHNDYDILDIHHDYGMIYAAFAVRKEAPFMTDRSAFLSWIRIDKSAGTTVYSGINDENRLGLLKWSLQEMRARTRPWRNRWRLNRSGLRRLFKGGEQ